ncbi:hypothetical protein C6A33_01255 [Streptococcus anginosus]|uniref:hypothetical protein n=1 Tax=Streptococcus anginosus TaxID=1328 RepID=UPI000D047167|nr:hypothetical protein [Streptococcus anginosus]PRT63900.1 hypothetical protein C6A33_01255 [Streptococcus anginosus]
MKTIQEINEIYDTAYKNAEQYLDEVMSALSESEERSFIMWNWLILFLLLFISLFYFSNIIIKIIIGFILFVLAIAIICLIIDFHNDPNKN